MFRTILAASAILVSLDGAALAIDVYPGCAVPVLKAGHRTFYVDPIKGTDKGDGSAQKPWKDLSSIIGVSNKYVSAQAWSNKTSSYAPVNPAGPIKAGDTIMLMSGNYGSIRILNTFNNDFVWVMAAPGQTPIINQLEIISSGKWVFQGITFEGMTPKPVTDPNKKVNDRMVSVGNGDYTGVTNNIVFTADTFRTTADSSKWSDLDWIVKPYFTAFHSRATCVSLTGSKIYNVFDGVMLGLDHNYMANNAISYFANDGVDFTHGDTTIRNNTFLNGKNNKLNGQHSDAIQGWSDFVVVNGVKQASLNKNIVIENNRIEKYGDPNISYLQGISVFDGKWDNITIQNNSVITNTANGIALFGAVNSKIVNNTIIASGTSKTMLWARAAKDGTPLNNVVIRNNVAPILAISDKGIIADHNVFNNQLITTVNGAVTSLFKSQSTSQTTLAPSAASVFLKVDNQARVYDLRPASKGAAYATGSANDAPATDITGKTRAKPTDIGSYSH